MTAPRQKPLLVIVGQTPPPWHGQAIATQMLFDARWDGFEVRPVRMAFSGEMEEIGHIRLGKIFYLPTLWRAIRHAVGGRRDAILLYPPASPNWVPMLRDLILLPLIRGWFEKSIYIYHAGGVGEWLAKSRLRRLVARLAYGQADLSMEVARESPAPHQILGARTWAWTPYGVEVPPPPDRRSPPSGPFTALFVGSLQEGKGVLEVLKTARTLKDRGLADRFRIHIVGRWFSEDFQQEATALVDSLGIGDMVTFLGQLTGDAKWRVYQEADVFFFPTHYESEAFPLVLIEALGCGLPVVTTRWRGIPDLLADCSTAVLCHTRAPDEFADALTFWEFRRPQAADTARSAKDYYHDRYRPGQFLDQVKALASTVAGIAPTTRESSGARCFAASPTPLRAAVYLADQNPGHDRSFGISRMTQVVLETIQKRGLARIEVIASKTSQQAPAAVNAVTLLPWGTRRKSIRLLTDHLHPLFSACDIAPDLYYYPKGYLPLTSSLQGPNAVTIHDTIVQYDEDHYPEWRNSWEYSYWAMMLKHTLRNADCILTVSEASKGQILHFMERHGIPIKPIRVTYEPCAYEDIPQPIAPIKSDYVIHLASREPHKRTHQLVRWWIDGVRNGLLLPKLHLIGSLPPETIPLIADCDCLVKRPFLEDSELMEAYAGARALMLPSEIEGFGLPALEAYYLGTPVCHVRGTSVEEILGVATSKGLFSLDDPDSLFRALDEVMQMTTGEIHQCGQILRSEYAAEKIATRMVDAFSELARQPSFVR